MGVVMRFLTRLVFYIAIFAIVSFAAFDDPEAVYRSLYQDIRCQMGETCFETSPMILPGVSVYFVDKALANRDGRDVAILASSWPYCYDPTGEVYRVSRYFETDFASIPDWAQFYINPKDKSVIGAAIVHDWLYAVGEPGDEAAKRRADEIFRHELKEAGVNSVKRNIMYAAVSTFGGRSFGGAEEMRFRNPGNGKAFTKNKPSKVVIDKIDPECKQFFDKYWDMNTNSNLPAHYLHPNFIHDWIDLVP